MSDLIHKAAYALQEETIALRRDLHAHPELAFEEVRTAKIVSDQLAGLGLKNIKTNVGKTGVTAVLDTGKAGKTVLARADMDALPVQEERNELEFRSTIDGKMHACGHDGHTAILLSTAKLLSQHQEHFSGKVVFVFQPAEETVEGAKAMLADNALEDYKVDHSLGLHLSSMHPLGTASMRKGPAFAATDLFEIQLIGKGGHAAMPHSNIDPVVAASQLIMALQTLVSRETNPVDQAVLSMTSFQAGSTYNVIPEEVNMKGTLRTFNDETRAFLKQRIQQVSEGLASTLRCNARVTFVQGCPAVINDETMTEVFANVAASVLGDSQVERNAPMIMGSDDMSLWLQEGSGCYFFLGAANEELDFNYPHHHPKFGIDEASLPLAVEIFSKGIIRYLET